MRQVGNSAVSPFDGQRLGGDDVAAVHGVVAAAVTADLPGEPVPTLAEVAGRLRSRRDGRRTFRWIARDDAGGPVGHLVLGLPDLDNTHLGLFDLTVHPAHRRRGTGSALLREAATVAAANDRRTLLVEAYEGSPGAAFCAARGLRPVQDERISLLRLADVDWADVTALTAAAHPGYRLVGWTGETPDELLAGYAAAKDTMNDAPTGDMDWTGRVYTPEVLRAEEATLRSLGREPRVVLAVHEATGEVAALTEVAVLRDPRRSEQEDTAVVPGHRGSGLGLWVKAAMLVRLRAERPDVAELTTGNAADNAHMLRINDRIGFRPHLTLIEWQADVPALLARLT